LWKTNGIINASGTDTFVVRATVDVRATFDKNLSLTNIWFRDFQLNVIPYKEVSGNFFSMPAYPDGSSQLNTWTQSFFPPNHLDMSGFTWMDEGKCGIPAAFLPDTVVKLGVRVPKGLDGWLQGRLSNANVDIFPYSNNLNRGRISVQSQEPIKLRF
jgi:hypothetical protein